MRCRDERHSRKKSKTSNCGHRPFRGTCRGNRPRNGDRGRNQFPHRCGRFADERHQRQFGRPADRRCGRRKRKGVRGHAGSAQKKLEAAKDAASPEKIAGIDADIAALQEIYDKLVAEAAKCRGPLPAMQANVDAAQARYDEAHNRTSGLQAELNKAIDDGASNDTIKQLRSEIMSAERREKSCEDDLHHCQRRLESQKSVVAKFEANAEKCQTDIDEETAKRDALLDNLKKAQTAYDDACKAYEEAKAAADKATSPEITQPTETTPPSNSAQPAEATQPASSPATGKNTPPNSTKQANSSSGKQADTTAGKLANTGDTAPSAIALAGIAAMGLGITATATRRIKNSK